MMSIGFILPKESSKPIGGFKIVYEYANRFAEEGFDVFILYIQFENFQMEPFIRKLRLLHGLFANRKEQFPTSNWYILHHRIREIRIPYVRTWCIPHCDLYVATALMTSYELNELRVPPKRKYYFIQGFENWGVSNDYVLNSYKLLLKKIVISNWLQKIVADCGEKAIIVPNGFDIKRFNLLNPVMKRNRLRIAFMYHIDQGKGVTIAMSAFGIVKRKYPSLIVNTFSAYPKPMDLPDWYHYHQTPTSEEHNQLYNDSAIYVGASYVEGWGLTLGEAMMCGCAVACTDNKGYLEMAKDNDTALISPVGDAETLATNIIRLIEDDELRWRIAKRGNESIRKYDIEQSYKKMKVCFVSRCNEIW